MRQNISKKFVPNWMDSIYIEQILKIDHRPERIRYFSRICDGLSDYAYWYVLGTLWVNYSGWSDIELWKKLFSSSRPHRAECLMKPDELRDFEELPDPLVVYRAHRSFEKDWIAYTIEAETAHIFAWKRKVSEIAEYRLPKASAVAFFTRRGEAEIICPDSTVARAITTHIIPPCPEYLRQIEA